MTLPWSDPEATGIGRRVSYEKFRDDALRQIEYLRAYSDARLARFPRIRDAVLDFARDHVMEVIVRHWPDCELWRLEFDYERLSRTVTVDLVSSEDDRNTASLTVRSMVTWIDAAANKGWPQKAIYRKFVLHIDCPTAIVRETLELAYSDAKRYTADDLAQPDPTITS